MTTDRVMRWRLYIEEFGPTFHYVPGQNNYVADALSRLPQLSAPCPTETSYTLDILADCFGNNTSDLPSAALPLTYRLIAKQQREDPSLNKRLQTFAPSYHRTTFCGGNKSYDLICHNNQIVIPQSLRARVVEWYHQYLLHRGINRTEETIWQQLWWSTIRQDVTNYVTKCPVCQQNKKHHSQKQYGLLPEKEAEATPRDKLCVDLIGPYVIQQRAKHR